MKKRFLSLILVAGLALSMAACGGKTAPAEQPAEAVTAETETAQAGTGSEEQKETEGSTETEAPAKTQESTEQQTEGAESQEQAEQAEDNMALKKAKTGEVVDGIVKVKYQFPATVPENESLQFIKDLQIGYNLGNAFDASNCNWVSDELDYESAWCGAKTTQGLIRELKKAGFKTIRIPVSWHNHVDENYQISEAWLSRVQEVVDWAYNEGMYVIINIHHDNEKNFEYPSYEKLDQSKKYVTTIWSQLADRFADYDEHLIFESMNEPRQVGTDHEWWLDLNADYAYECIDCVNQLNQAVVDTIRDNGKGYNKTRYIMVPPYCANPDYAVADAFQLPDDSKADAENRIILSIHAYTPYDFALNLSGTKKFSVAEENGTADIDAFLKKIHSRFTIKGVPVLIGEFGALDKDNLSDRMEFVAYYIDAARRYGLTAVWWDNNAYKADGECFRIINRSDLSWTYPELVDQMMYYCVEHE